MGFEAVIFDYEGVLVEMNRERAASFFRGRSPISVKDLTRRWEAWCSDHAGDTLLADEMWHSMWDALRLEHEISDATFAELRAFDFVGLLEVFPDALPALREARRLGLRIGVLSNSALPRLKAPSSPIALAELVDVIRVPARGVAVKPDREAFVAIARSLGTSPDRCLFLDNNPDFVRAARGAGMRGYLVHRGRGEAPADLAVLLDLSGLGRVAGAPGDSP